MFPIQEWTKDRVYNVMMELLYSFNYAWFPMEKFIRENFPEEIAQAGLFDLTDKFAANEAKLLEKSVEQESEGIDRLIGFLELSHWSLFEDFRITKLSDTRLRINTFGCTIQKAAKSWGMDYYDCTGVAYRARLSFLRYVNPKTTVTPSFLPSQKTGEPHSPGASCEWIVSIE